MRVCWRCCVAALLVCALTAPAAATTMDPEFVASLGGDVARHMAVAQRLAYCASPAGLRVYDVRDPSRPHLLGTCQAPSFEFAVGIALVDHYAYISTGDLVVYDVSDPASPTRIGACDQIRDVGTRLFVHGGYGYLVDFSGLVVLDLSDPELPQVVYRSYDDTIGYAARIAFSGNHAYCAGSPGGVTVFDISDPTAPLQVARLDALGWPTDTVISGTHLFICYGESGVQILDISVPTAPLQVGSLSNQREWVSAIAVSGRYAFVLEGDLDGSAIRVVDVSAPSDPQVVATYNTAAQLVGLALDGDELYASVCSSGFMVLGIAEPAAPVVLSSFTAPSAVRAVHLAGGYAYLCESQGVHAVDVSHPDAPQVVGSLRTLGYEATVASGAALVYCLPLADDATGLRILDFSDPVHPEEASWVYSDTRPGPVAASVGYAYVVDGQNSLLRILDVSDPHAPTEVGALDIAGWQYPYEPGCPVRLLMASESCVYAIGFDGLLRIVDVSDPTAPTEVGSFSWYGAVEGWTLRDSYLYLAQWGAGLRIVDVSDPRAPATVVMFPIDEPAPGMGGRAVTDVAVAGCYAYLTTNDGAVLVVDVSQPTAPVWVGSYPIQPLWVDIGASGRHIFVSQCGRGLLVLRNPAPFADIPSAFWAFAEIGACRDAGIVCGYGDETYHPGQLVTRAQMAVYTARALAGADESVPTGPTTVSFPDVPTDHWAYKYVEYARSRGIVQGYWDGYRPLETVDRAQMAVFVSRSICDPTGEEGLASYVPPTTPTFTDVSTDFWACKYIEYLHDRGVVNGYWDGYRPNDAVNRAQTAVYIARAFELPM